MPHPVSVLPKQFNPRAFARNRQSISGEIPVSDTDEVKKIAADGRVITFEIFGSLDEDHRCHLSGRIETVLTMQCQRCLELMELPIDCKFDYILIRHEKEEERVEDGSETLLCPEDYLDLKWFLEEEILLVAPVIAKHDNCDLLMDTAQEEGFEQPARENPFSELKNLIRNKE